MLTPAYAPTATERVLPRLALDFTTGVLDPRVTVTRALNTATRVNSSGLIELVNADLPRFDYNPVTLAPKGLLIEETRTNLMLRSQEFEDASFTKNNTNAAANTATSPDGTVNADSVTASNGNTQHFVSQSFSFTSGTSYTISVFAKKNTLNAVQLTFGSAAFGTFPYANFDVNAGTTAAFNCTSTITNFGNGWCRCTMTATASATTTAVAVIALARDTSEARIAAFSSDGNGIYLYGGQLEAGAFATSYIPTVASQVTRNADAVYMAGTNLTNWYNATEGALLVQATAEISATDANVRFAAILYDTVAYANALRLERLSGNYRGVKTVSGSSLVASFAWATNVTGKAIMAYKDSNSATSFRAASPGLYAGGVPGSIAYLGIGGNHQGGNTWCGHVQRIQYWPQRVINAETQAFTKD